MISEEEWECRCRSLGYNLVNFGGNGKANSEVYCTSCKTTATTRLTNLYSGFVPCKCSSVYRESAVEKGEKVKAKAVELGFEAELNKDNKHMYVKFDCGHTTTIKYYDF